jgi:hypothetical protein
VKLNFGDVIEKADFENIDEDAFGRRVQRFNKLLTKKLHPLVINTENEQSELLRENFKTKCSLIYKIILFIPGIAGYILHAPLYLPVRRMIRKKLSGTGHYDSGIVATLFIIYPLWICALTILSYTITTSLWSLCIPLLLYFTAFSYVRLKKA